MRAENNEIGNIYFKVSSKPKLFYFKSESVSWTLCDPHVL